MQKEYYKVIVLNKQNKQLDDSKQFETYDEAKNFIEKREAKQIMGYKFSNGFDIHDITIKNLG